MNEQLELGMVIPIYNEKNNIAALVHDWQQVLQRHQIRYKLFLINDGSKDESLCILNALAERFPCIHVHSHENRGHGPSIWKGYQLAANSNWIFQIDGDHQFETEAFSKLWANREDYDLLIGQRREKNATSGRNVVSFISKILVYLFFGRGIKDVNCPYRLMRTSKLREALELIPERTFAPNVLISSFFVQKKLRIFKMQINPRKDAIPKQSKLSPTILKGSLHSIMPVIFFRFKI
ncbi:MAG: glycosyltransferase family 2 protein [Chitinophagales bacterium]